MAAPENRPSPRRVACEVLRRVEEEGAYSDLALDSALRATHFERRDRGLVTELVYGVLRLRGRLDFALSGFCSRPLQRLQGDVLRALRLGAYQLLELDRIPAHAAVDSSVVLVRELGQPRAAGLVNAVLRELERRQQQIDWPGPETIRSYLQRVCSLPVWLAREIMRGLPNDQARALGESLARSAPLTLRCNTLKIDPETLLTALDRAGHEARPCRYAPEGIRIVTRGEQPLPGDAQGWYQVQDQASMLIAHLLAVAPGQRILDACAAPGGKTTHLAALAGNRASILALDKYPARLARLGEGILRLGCDGVESRAVDLELSAGDLQAAGFDRVLVDAPCSGLGVLRRNPEGRWQQSPARLRRLAKVQRRILAHLADKVRPGGLLVYSVCTFSAVETDVLIDSFLREHVDFTLEAPDDLPDSWKELLTDRGTLRTYPHRHDAMDAFFAARLRRRG